MGRLILVEGIPGSGKTTISKKIAEYLSKIKKTKYYEEGDSHPADLAWCACIPKEELAQVAEAFPAYKKSMEEYGYEEGGYYIVPYTRFPVSDPLFYQRMESYEVYDNRVGYDTFVDLHLKKWIKFSQMAAGVDEYTVFECSYLQNHINELLLFHHCNEAQIEAYLLKLIDTVKDLKPVIFYLEQQDISETLQRVSKIRVDENGNQVWRDRVISYLEGTPYAVEHQLQGFAGMIEYFFARKQMELRILEHLPVESHIITNNDFDWQQVWEQIEEILQNSVATVNDLKCNNY